MISDPDFNDDQLPDELDGDTPLDPASQKSIENILVDAALAAEMMLPALEEKRANVQKSLAQLETSIVRLKSIVAGAAEFRSTAELADGGRDSVGAGPDIDNALLGSGEHLRVADLRKSIKRETGRLWASSTLSNLLTRGKSEGRYNNDDAGWFLTSKGLDEIL